MKKKIDLKKEKPKYWIGDTVAYYFEDNDDEIDYGHIWFGEIREVHGVYNKEQNDVHFFYEVYKPNRKDGEGYIDNFGNDDILYKI